MIINLNKGYLKYPSDELFNLLYSLENAILQTIGEEQLNFYTFQHIVKNVLAESLNFVGCENHKKTLTKTIINFYCVSRTHILCKKHNDVYNEVRKEEKKYRKLSKLVGITSNKKLEENYSNENEKKGQINKRKRKAGESKVTSNEKEENYTNENEKKGRINRRKRKMDELKVNIKKK